MMNLTLQPYSTKLAKHQPPDLRHPTEKGESAGLQRKKTEREEVTCFKHCIKTTTKLGPVPDGWPEERESSPHLSMVSARVSSSGAHRQRYTLSQTEPNFPTLPIYQFSRPTGGWGREKGGRRVLHYCLPRCPRSGTINIIILVRSSAGQRAETGNTDQTITSLKNKQV